MSRVTSSRTNCSISRKPDPATKANGNGASLAPAKRSQCAPPRKIGGGCDDSPPVASIIFCGCAGATSCSGGLASLRIWPGLFIADHGYELFFLGLPAGGPDRLWVEPTQGKRNPGGGWNDRSGPHRRMDSGGATDRAPARSREGHPRCPARGSACDPRTDFG